MTEGRVSGWSATHRPDGRSPALSNVFGTPKQCPHGSGYSDLFPHAIIYGRIFAGQPRTRPTGLGQGLGAGNFSESTPCDLEQLNSAW